VPTAALAQSPPAGAQPAAAPASESISVSVKRHALAGQRLKLGGKVGSGAKGRTVLIQKKKGDGWKTVARTRTRATGVYSAYWRLAGTGRQRLRAFVRGGDLPVAQRIVRGGVTGYRLAGASWVRTGLLRRASRLRWHPRRRDARRANKTLPCGSKVTLRYKGRSVTVPVIDREGPTSGDVDFDLTAATKQKLGFGSTGTVWSTK